MRQRIDRPRLGFAFWRAGTSLALASTLTFLPVAASPAFAFKIFGMRFFESNEEEPDVIDPVKYTLTFDAGTDDDDLKSAIEASALLKQDEEQPVSGNLGLVIKARDDRDRILAALYENARYGGVVDISINGTPIDSLPPIPQFPAGAVPVNVTVRPGPAFTFDSVTLRGDAAGRNPADYGLVQGARADSTVIIRAGEKVVADLKAQSRPLAHLTDRQAIADHTTNTVDVVIAAEGGPVADLGDVKVTGTRDVDAGFVKYYSRINAGQPYSPEQLTKAADRLRQLGVFSSVTIREADKLAPDGSLPMTIEVSEGKMRYFGAGAQISTIDGLGLQGYWGHRNLFGRAESLRIEGAINGIGEGNGVNDIGYSLGAAFAKPGAFGPASTFTASLKAAINDTDAFYATTVTAAAGATFELSDFDTVSGGGEVAAMQVDDPFGDNFYLTAAIPLEYVRDTRDNKLNPTTGYRAMINAKPTYEFERGTFFSSFEASGSAYRAIGAEERVVLAGRLGAGTIVGAPTLADIPAPRRFYLGGGGSVRGYGFQDISPRNSDGEAVGGRSYVLASAEVRVSITETIGIVPFLDVGTVSRDALPDFSDIRAGAGVGLRYATPFGPIRLDVAVPLHRYDAGDSFGIYAGIGQSF
ncbi:autotransporter secretion outer membrane protein TamA [Rhizobium subbaraonis]|uniref:Autotransporter secretion outer membrane protein TamA n=1 Tax=Rhizobium subbaraonis TaxID=908946 RepID=A0A285UPG7_9HYPH|nr:autotransporter assembly complex family protein [Rhizobium subbaraonis]SOC43597.1 autotransporter secretion outer membrane protein TamA [Rhizobium subbaraonis]